LTRVAWTILAYRAAFGADELAEFLRRVADRFRGLRLQHLLNARVAQRLDGGLVQALEDRRRRAGTGEQAEPVGEVEILEPRRLGQRRNIGEFRRATSGTVHLVHAGVVSLAARSRALKLGTCGEIG